MYRYLGGLIQKLAGKLVDTLISFFILNSATLL